MTFTTNTFAIPERMPNVEIRKILALPLTPIWVCASRTSRLDATRPTTHQAVLALSGR